ncbi:MAG: NADH-quinone oxidoreductase subunit H [Planctomycetes bacterium]|nr:NADH-quinone oxidoreductase subunit H [Planctomycetota bacterium]
MLAILFAPLLLGVVNRVKAWVGGRRGPPVLQAYWDLAKLLRKGAVYSRSTTWIFRAGPIVGVCAALVATALLPVGDTPALMGFPGDLILLAYVFGLARFFTVLAALDTGSSFEGMGASREVQFSALAEPALLLALAAVARNTGSTSLTGMMQGISVHAWTTAGPALALVSAALLLVFLAENARIPVDDPATHLELTMIHEVMVLDHGGPDFAFVLYGAALKLWVLGALLVGIAVPVRSGDPWIDAAGFAAGMLALAVVVGAVESSMARLKLLRVPQLLAGAAALSALALILVLR